MGSCCRSEFGISKPYRGQVSDRQLTMDLLTTVSKSYQVIVVLWVVDRGEHTLLHI